MRKAYNYDKGFPTKEWIVTAALLYDVVVVSSSLMVPWPTTLLNELDTSEREVLDFCNRITVEPGDRSFLEPLVPHHQWMFDEITSIACHESRRVDLDLIVELLKQAEHYAPEVDLFGSANLTDVRGIKQSAMLSVLVPIKTSDVSPSQIADFRAINELRRAKFQKAADDLVKSFGETTTEDDANRILRLVGQELREQQDKLETIYRHTKIEAAARMVGTIGGPPALLGVVGSVLGIACVEAAGFVASVSLSIVPWLIAREKADMTINDSPWAYLWHMKRDLGFGVEFRTDSSG